MRKVLFTTVVFLGLLAGLCANDIVPQGTTNNLQTELEPSQVPLDDSVLNPLYLECLNHNSTWYYYWYRSETIGRASTFLLDAGFNADSKLVYYITKPTCEEVQTVYFV